jgi:hypothetical protein
VGTLASSSDAAATAIHRIFYGATKSVIKAPNIKPSATVHHFSMLHLEIDVPHVHDIESALLHHFVNETVGEYLCLQSAAAAVPTWSCGRYCPEVPTGACRAFP